MIGRIDYAIYAGPDVSVQVDEHGILVIAGLGECFSGQAAVCVSNVNALLGALAKADIWRTRRQEDLGIPG